MFNFFKNESLGALGERVAKNHYKALGFKIVGENFFNRTGKQLGEIDFIAITKQDLVFVEVKTRTAEISAFGSAVDAVTASKQQKLVKIAKLFMQNHVQYSNLNPRIDVCSILCDSLDKTVKNITIIPNAVEDMY